MILREQQHKIKTYVKEKKKDAKLKKSINLLHFVEENLGKRKRFLDTQKYRLIEELKNIQFMRY